MKISPALFYKNPYRFNGLFHKKNKDKPERKIYKNYKSAMLEGQFIHKGALFNRHSTMYFRPDLDWAKFGQYLKNKFSNCDKVQSYIWGCSYGDEAYSLAILLKHCFREDSKRFLPISAMDINSKLIQQDKCLQQSGFLLDLSFIESMKRAFEMQSVMFDLGKIGEYCKLVSCSKFRLKDEVLNSVNFSYSNILTDIDKTDFSGPSIIMCRNMWPYISPDRYDDFAKKLYNSLKDGSVVVIGGYDYEGEKHVKNSNTFPKALVKNGFKPVKDFHIRNEENSIIVFEK